MSPAQSRTSTAMASGESIPARGTMAVVADAAEGRAAAAVAAIAAVAAVDLGAKAVGRAFKPASEPCDMNIRPLRSATSVACFI